MDRRSGWLLIDELRVSAVTLLETLDVQDWDVPSLCEGWTVREVAAHLSVAALTPYRGVLVDVVRARGSFDQMVHDNAVRRAAGRSADQIVADLRSTVGSRRLAPTTFWRDPLLDLVVHTQDIARPLGRTADVVVPSDAVLIALDWVWRRGFPFFPGRRLRGLRLLAVDADWQRGAGLDVTGPALALLLLSTGRRAALADLAGPGVAHLGGTHPITKPASTGRHEKRSMR